MRRAPPPKFFHTHGPGDLWAYAWAVPELPNLPQAKTYQNTSFSNQHSPAFTPRYTQNTPARSWLSQRECDIIYYIAEEIGILCPQGNFLNLFFYFIYMVVPTPGAGRVVCLVIGYRLHCILSILVYPGIGRMWKCCGKVRNFDLILGFLVWFECACGSLNLG